ncbi:MAG: putative toxin-antitoxin system toxin component, PIN family [Victivallales bacterium]|nr:putative toxin-antitoxin system toxin component, PIN family [Victivallales bacterium]
MKIHAVIDTNVLVSALLAKRADSAPVLIIEKVFEGAVVPVFSKEIVREYFDVLHREKFGFDPNTVNCFLQELLQRGIQLDPSPIDTVLPDIKDSPFYAVALSNKTNETYLVTGNLKHFPAKPLVVSPVAFLNILQAYS